MGEEYPATLVLGELQVVSMSDQSYFYATGFGPPT